MIRALNGIQIHIPKVGVGDVAVGPFDWNGLNLGTIPRLAVGHPRLRRRLGDARRARPRARPPAAGHATCSPRPRAATSWPASSGRAGPLIGTQTIYGVQPGDVERETRRALRRAALAWSLEGA